MNLLKTLRHNYLLQTLWILIFLLLSCGGEETNSDNKKNDSEDEAITAVTVENLQTEHFKVYLNYYSKLRGIKETTVGALIGGRIEKINYSVGESVKEKDVVVQFPIDAPASMYEQTKSAYENSEKNYERAKVLLESGETSQSTFDGLKTQYLVDKRNYETQQQMLFVEAPFDGKITELNVEVGDNVQSKDPLFAVAQLNKMVTKVWATEDEIKNIKKEMSAEIESGGKIYFGKVTEISLVADPYKQSFYAEIQFDNPDGKLKSGVTVDIAILVYENKNSIVLPRNIVKEDDKGGYVFVEENAVAKKRYITLGRESGINYEITAGLNAGENLITKGIAQLSDGSKVKVIR